jgi:arsenite methyltransferase
VTGEPDLKQTIQTRYGARADLMARADAGSCCSGGSSCCGDTSGGANAFSAGLYPADDVEGLPLEAELGSLGCGNPIALSELRPGETVLDLGSGGGLDVLLAAGRVGSQGHVYGVDMTAEMLRLAWDNAERAGVGNVTFLKGDIERIPVPDGSIDVVISNCVINLAVDKSSVFREIHRVLRPGGRLAVTDIVIAGGLADVSFADTLRADQEAWGSCIAGALSDAEYARALAETGFTDVGIEILRRHSADDLFPGGRPAWARTVAAAEFAVAMARFASAFVRSVKPVPSGVPS